MVSPPGLHVTKPFHQGACVCVCVCVCLLLAAFPCMGFLFSHGLVRSGTRLSVKLPGRPRQFTWVFADFRATQDFFSLGFGPWSPTGDTDAGVFIEELNFPLGFWLFFWVVLCVGLTGLPVSLFRFGRRAFAKQDFFSLCGLPRATPGCLATRGGSGMGSAAASAA